MGMLCFGTTDLCVHGADNLIRSYRKPLRDKLRSEGWEVDMVGSKQGGSMVDNVRGYSCAMTVC